VGLLDPLEHVEPAPAEQVGGKDGADRRLGVVPGASSKATAPITRRVRQRTEDMVDVAEDGAAQFMNRE
jgi:hypothetical protein